MSISRRKFLRAGTVAALAAGIPLKAALLASGQGLRKGREGNPIDRPPVDGPVDQLSFYTMSAFSSYLNSEFLLQAGAAGAIAVILTEVKDSGSAPRPAGQECFTLVFRNSGGPVLSQGTYGVEHGALGSFALFLVPGGADQNGGQRYVATVNRLANSPALFAAPVR